MERASELRAPLVSCLMVTKDRLSHFRRSWSCFCRQTYPHTELVIVSSAGLAYCDAIREVVGSCDGRTARIVPVEDDPPLGALRNIAVAAAQGAYVCQWDDDDLYHPERIAVQMAQMTAQRKQVSFLTDQLHALWDASEMYWCDWSSWRLGGVAPNTLLAEKAILPAYEASLNRYEDASLLRALLDSEVPICRVRDFGYLYIYGYHGTNTFQRAHHLSIIASQAFPGSYLRERRESIATALEACGVPSPVRLLGVGGEPAFLWPGPVPGAMTARVE